ncbi:MAG: DUF1223 domain-containing protein [Synechococcaceae cyanobacterium SM1_2_3]|nr:DUF1223 domain-containing protein [Synechococcaceae cyanobacterium SM1_2_3]
MSVSRIVGDSERWRSGQWATLALSLLVAGAFPAIAPAAQCRTQSGPGQTALIELYTSEGCSSCPPADRWLADLAAEPALHDKAVLLALHVDYWDNLGWRDRFAQPDFSARQRNLVAAQGSTTVFTPQVMVNGRTTLELDRDTAFRQRIAAINARPAAADLTLELIPASESWRVQVQGRLQSHLPAAHAGVFVALYQNGLSSQITAGENAARRLRHER